MNVASMSAGTLTASVGTAASLPSWFVVVMGLGIVFIGLVCIVFLCTIMSKIITSLEAKHAVDAPVDVPAPTAPTPEPIANRQELIAAISAALAEELGKDVSAIRIISMKKV